MPLRYLRSNFNRFYTSGTAVGTHIVNSKELSFENAIDPPKIKKNCAVTLQRPNGPVLKSILLKCLDSIIEIVLMFVVFEIFKAFQRSLKRFSSEELLECDLGGGIRVVN